MAANEKPEIVVFGAGSWGTALAILLARNGASVTLYGRGEAKIKAMQEAGCNLYYLPDIPFPNGLSLCSSVADALKNCTDDTTMLVVVPSHAFRATIKEIYALIPQLKALAWATKGLEHDTQKLLHEVFREEFGDAAEMAVISGPTFAGEVAHGLPTAVTIAASNDDYARHLSMLLGNETFRPYISQDIIGLEIGGAVKNVLAIAAGIADGLGFGANTRSALITRGLVEMARLCEAMGGSRETMMGLSGLGDLLLTCTDDQSRNRRLGLAVGTGQSVSEALASINQVVEGVQGAREIFSLSRLKQVEMPIVEQVYRVLHQGLAPKDAVHNLLTREYKSE